MAIVLVVDDEPDIRLLCRLVLESVGHTVSEADTAEAALAAIPSARPDFVILDVRMPGMGGWELLALLRADGDRQAVRIIISSAHSGPAEERRALLAGAYAFLAKPFGPQNLLDLVPA
jgi:CheY-like chemotaxis protein